MFVFLQGLYEEALQSKTVGCNIALREAPASLNSLILLSLVLLLSSNRKRNYKNKILDLHLPVFIENLRMSSSYTWSNTHLVSTVIRDGIGGYISREKLEERLYEIFGQKIELVVSIDITPSHQTT